MKISWNVVPIESPDPRPFVERFASILSLWLMQSAMHHFPLVFFFSIYQMDALCGAAAVIFSNWPNLLPLPTCSSATAHRSYSHHFFSVYYGSPLGFGFCFSFRWTFAERSQPLLVSFNYLFLFFFPPFAESVCRVIKIDGNFDEDE